jgi:hypothetical protein
MVHQSSATNCSQTLRGMCGPCATLPDNPATNTYMHVAFGISFNPPPITTELRHSWRLALDKR